ncbi:MAG TPA: F0F1 ATP synthase subunit epsilon [Mycobacteriales bacterium]|nr:F0F1 ATP synthase subunit epsilon [Mycobacteriales bacterium]
MAVMQVELVSAERRLWSGEAEMVVARTTEGEIGVLPGHAPLLGELGSGPVRIIEPSGNEIVAAIHGGFLSVTGDGVSILADIAELAADIDVSRAQASLDRSHVAADDDADARAAAARATARLRASELAAAR